MATNKAWQECLDEAWKESFDGVDGDFHQLAAEKYAVRFAKYCNRFIDEEDDWFNLTYTEQHQRFIEENNK